MACRQFTKADRECRHERDSAPPLGRPLRPFLFVILGLLAATIGCATHSNRLREVRTAFHAGDLDRAKSLLGQDVKEQDRDLDVLHLDEAIIQLAAGEPRKAEQLLRPVRDRFDFLEQKDALESVISLATDDQRLAYAGEDYEKVLIRAMLCLSNLLGDGQDALAYSHQVGQKQQAIIEAGGLLEEENPKLQYQRVALGPYLQGVLREGRFDQLDAARRSYLKVVSWAPGFQAGKADLERARDGHRPPPGRGVVYIFALVGRGPYKEETIEQPASAALLIADRILSATGKYTLPPTVAPVKVPKVVLPHNEINTVKVFVDAKPAGRTTTITDVGQLAAQQHAAIYSSVIARAVVRRVVKKAVVVGGKEALNVGHPLTNLVFDLAGVAWEAAESADTRCWGLLPAKIQVLRLELPVGDHQVGLQAGRGAQSIGSATETSVHVRDGRNTYVLANFPTRDLVGEILVR